MEVILKRVWFTAHGRFRPDGNKPVTVPDELRDQLPSDARLVGEKSPTSAPAIQSVEEFEPVDSQAADSAPSVITAEDALARKGEPFMAFKAAAKQVLGQECPQTKEEIIAALKDASIE